MLYSRQCEDAIRAMAYLARQPQDRLISVGEVAKAENLAAPFLARTLFQLAKAGLVLSRKGPGGGFRLARPAVAIRLRDIVAVMDGLEGLKECAVGLAECSDRMPCPLHGMWKELRQRIEVYLEKTRLSDMAQAVERKRSLLALSRG